jgi:hypothetical protein
VLLLLPAVAGAAPWVFAMAALIQGLAIAAFLYGRRGEASENHSQ